MAPPRTRVSPTRSIERQMLRHGILWRAVLIALCAGFELWLLLQGQYTLLARLSLKGLSVLATVAVIVWCVRGINRRSNQLLRIRLRPPER